MRHGALDEIGQRAEPDLVEAHEHHRVVEVMIRHEEHAGIGL